MNIKITKILNNYVDEQNLSNLIINFTFGNQSQLLLIKQIKQIKYNQQNKNYSYIDFSNLNDVNDENEKFFGYIMIKLNKLLSCNHKDSRFIDKINN